MPRRDKTVSETCIETYHIVRPTDLNSANRLFGGSLMAWIDEVAALVAKRHCQTNVTTGTVDNLTFLHPVYLRDTLVLTGKVTYVGNTSLEVKVESHVEDYESGNRRLINVAYITLIALDENDRPVRVPRLILESDEEHAEWTRAEERKKHRKIEKQKIDQEG